MSKVTVFKNPLEWDNAKNVLAFIGLVFTGSAPPMNTTKFDLALTDQLLTITAFTQNDQNEWVDYVKEIDVKKISFCSLDQQKRELELQVAEVGTIRFCYEESERAMEAFYNELIAKTAS